MSFEFATLSTYSPNAALSRMAKTVISYIIIAVVVTALSCGNIREPDPVPQEFDGDWAGVVTVTIPPEIVRSYDATLQMSVSGRAATLGGLCPDGTGSVVLGGFDGIIAWSGSIMCPPSWVLGCAVALEYTEVKAWLEPDGALSLRADGNAHRSPISDLTCSGYVPYAMEFAGTRN